jgi:NitT/TauT family transport system ATP-binding protein
VNDLGARVPGGGCRGGAASLPPTHSDIHVQGLRKVYRQKGSGVAVVAIERLDFTVRRGEVVAIVGKTGCGKSTFFNVLIGLEPPTEGSVEIGGRTPYGDFDHFRGRIGIIFQQDRLLPWRSLLDNVTLGLEIMGIDPGERRARAERWLSRLGLDGFLRAFPGELSGGMRQRAALARAFAVNPEILLADEAFGHLDEVTARQIRSQFFDMVRDERKTAILVTHQLEEAIDTGDRLLVFGRPATLLADLRLDNWRPEELPGLRARIQATLQNNEPDPLFIRPGEISR